MGMQAGAAARQAAPGRQCPSAPPPPRALGTSPGPPSPRQGGAPLSSHVPGSRAPKLCHTSSGFQMAACHADLPDGGARTTCVMRNRRRGAGSTAGGGACHPSPPAAAQGSARAGVAHPHQPCHRPRPRSQGCCSSSVGRGPSPRGAITPRSCTHCCPWHGRAGKRCRLACASARQQWRGQRHRGVIFRCTTRPVPSWDAVAVPPLCATALFHVSACQLDSGHDQSCA